MIRFQNSLKDMIWKFSDKKGYAGFNKLEEIAEEIKLYPEIYFCIYGSNTPPLEARVKFGFAKLFSKAS